MHVAVSDACEFTDNDRRHALPVKVLDELTSERGYRMSETVLPYPVEFGELLRLLPSIHADESLLVSGYAVGPVPPIRQ
jgi:hypothetical protein